MTPLATKIAFVVNGDFGSAMGERARGFAGHLRHQYEIRIFYRSANRLISIGQFLLSLARFRPALTWVFDMAYSGVFAAAMHKLATRNRLIIDTGDQITALAESMGRSALGRWLTRRLEKFSYRAADAIVVRGSFHRDFLRERGIAADLIRDGVDAAQFAAPDVSAQRRGRGFDGVLTVGVLGSSVWNEKLQMCYGWELVEVIHRLRDEPVQGVMIGGGSGIGYLQRLAREYGIEDRIQFLGFVPYAKLPRELAIVDVCISTQTNDVAGRVRTTGKLPLYLASGRHILASRVGEAALLLDDEMLVDYRGVIDPQYPVRLAERIAALLSRTIPFAPNEKHMAVAREQLDYSVLARQVASVIDRALGRSKSFQEGNVA
jgi:glycosyltransferase involved in cell wall biosynthesis